MVGGGFLVVWVHTSGVPIIIIIILTLILVRYCVLITLVFQVLQHEINNSVTSQTLINWVKMAN